jgi:hypothetical protein
VTAGTPISLMVSSAFKRKALSSIAQPGHIASTTNRLTMLAFAQFQNLREAG